MREIELAKIIGQMVPQLYLLDHPIRSEWGKLLELIINDQKFYYITYNTGGKGGGFYEKVFFNIVMLVYGVWLVWLQQRH